MQESTGRGTSRLGMTLFLLYAAFYLGFVLVNGFAAQWADWQPIAGLNLAIIWGFGLIVVAFVFAIIYGLWAPKDQDGYSEAAQQGETK